MDPLNLIRAEADRVAARLTLVGADPHDDEDLRARKALLVLISVLILPVAALWGALYLAFGSPVGLVPLAYFVILLGAIAVFSRTGDFPWLLRVGQVDILLAPTLSMIPLGGFLDSAGVGLWGILAPLGALVFSDVASAARWYVAYLAVFLGSGIAGEVMGPIWAPPPGWFTSTMLALNIAVGGTIVFTLLGVFASQRRDALAALRQEQAKAENLLLNILPPTYPFKVEIQLEPLGDWDLEVYGPDGAFIDGDGQPPGLPELVVLSNPAAGTYTVTAEKAGFRTEHLTGAGEADVLRRRHQAWAVGQATALTAQLLRRMRVELVTTLHGEEPVSFFMLMQPRGDQDRLLRALDDVALGELESAVLEADIPEGDEARQPARIALEHSLKSLRDAGCEAVGRVVEHHPLDVLTSVVAETSADEVIVLTAPHFVEEFFHRDWASRARHKVGVPVLKLFFNPNPLIQALHIQSQINAQHARRIEQDARRAGFLRHAPRAQSLRHSRISCGSRPGAG